MLSQSLYNANSGTVRGNALPDSGRPILGSNRGASTGDSPAGYSVNGGGSTDVFVTKHPELAKDYAFLRQPTQRHQWMQGVRDAVRRDPAFLDSLGLTDGEKRAVRGLLVKAGVIQDPSRGMMGRLMDRVGEGFWDRIGGVDWGRHRAGGQLQELVGVEESVPGVDDADGKRIAGDVLKRLATRGELVASESVMHQRRLLGDGGASVSNGRRAMPVAGDSRVGLRNQSSFVGEPASSMLFVVGEEFRVNTYTSDNQFDVQTAVLANNRLVMVWVSDGQDGSRDGVYGQLYDGNGGRVGTEFRVNTYTSGIQKNPSVTALNDGFVVTWQSEGQDGSGDGVYGQVYDGNGGRVGTEFRVNTYTNSDQGNPSVTALNDGFLVTWTSSGQDGSSSGVYGQLYDANGERVGTEFRVNTYTDSYQSSPSVVALNDGFVVTWHSYGQDGSGYGVYGQVYDGNGGRVGTEFRVNTHTSNDQVGVSVTALNDGFVVTWSSDGQDGSGDGVYGQLYDVNGGRVGTEFRVNMYTYNSQSGPSVTALNDGFVVTWHSKGQDRDGYGVYRQLYDANGEQVGMEFPVNTHTSNDQVGASVTALNDGFVVTWVSDEQDGSGYGVYGQLYDGNGGRVGTEFRVNTYTTDYQINPSVTALNDGFVVIWRSSGQDGSGYGIYAKKYTRSPLDISQISDSAAIGDRVGNFNDGYTYTLIAGEGDTHNAYVSISGTGLYLQQLLNYNTMPFIAIRVRKTDSAGDYTDYAMVISVSNSNAVSNAPPTAVGVSSTQVMESVSVGSVVATLDATDPNSADEHTYELIAGDGDGDNTYFNINGNELRLAKPLDYETQSSLTIRVRATDAGGLFVDQIITLSVQKVNELSTNTNMPFFSGEEFRVNTYTTDDQINPSVTALNDGFVVTWTSVDSTGSDQDGSGVYGQLYDGNGGRVGTEFRVNTYTDSYQSSPSVTALNDGFVVTWVSYGQDGSGYGVYGQLYDGNGVRVGTEFRVNTYTDNLQSNPSVTALNDGFVVTWESEGQDDSYSAGVYGQLYDGNGGRVGAEFRVNTYTKGDQENLSVTALNDGFVVTWESGGQDGSGDGIYGQLYDGNGGRVGTEFRVNTYTDSLQRNPSVIALNDGFVVTWESYGQDGYSSWGVYGQLYDGNGGRVGTEFRVNTYMSNHQRNPSVTALNEGFVVTWQSGVFTGSGQDGSGDGVYGQLYDGNGGRVGTEFQVNTYTDNSQENPSVTALNDGFVVTWLSYGQDGSGYGVYGQLYDGNGGRVGTEFQVNTYTSNEQGNPSVTALNDGFVVAWQSEGQDGSESGIYAKKYTRSPLDISQISDSAAIGDRVGNFNDGYTYTLIAGEGDTHNAYVSISGTGLYLQQLLNYNTMPVIAIRVRKTDSSGDYTDYPMVISVSNSNASSNTPPNAPPTAPPPPPSLKTIQISESLTVGTVIGDIGELDVRFNDAHTYQLIDTIHYPDNAYVRIESGQLILGQSVNYNEKQSLEIRIQAIDNDGNTVVETITITISDSRADGLQSSKNKLPNVRYGADKNTIFLNFAVSDYFNRLDANKLSMAFRINGDPAETNTYPWLQIAYLNHTKAIQLAANPSIADVGTYTIDVVMDDGNGPVEQQFSFEVFKEEEVIVRYNANALPRGALIVGTITGSIAAIFVALIRCMVWCCQCRSNGLPSGSNVDARLPQNDPSQPTTGTLADSVLGPINHPQECASPYPVTVRSDA
jgi:hypothetical protein